MKKNTEKFTMQVKGHILKMLRNLMKNISKMVWWRYL